MRDPLRARLTVTAGDPLFGTLQAAYIARGEVSMFDRRFVVTGYNEIECYPNDVTRFDLLEIVVAR